MTTFSQPPSALREAVLGALSFAVADMAMQKHIAVLPEEQQPIAVFALEMLCADEMREIMRMKPAALALAQKAVNHALDVFVASRLAYAMTMIEGKVRDPLTIMAVAEKCLNERIANDKPATMLIWRDPVEMAQEIFARRDYLATQPVHITFGRSTVEYTAERSNG